MRTLRAFAFLAMLIPAGTAAEAQVQIAPPSDPMDPVTGNVQPVTTVEQRGAAVALMTRAVDQYSLHSKGTPAHILQIAFNATASTLFPGGAGQLRETWISGQNWRWDAALGNYSLLRISSSGVAYDQQTPQPIPLRLKMLANAVFAPLQFTTPRVAAMRTANVVWKGAAVTCILLSPEGSVATGAGRQWDESEFCIDSSTGLLDVYSEVPGIYAFYDYTNALKFHDRVLPGSVTIDENGENVVQAQLTSVTDTNASDTSPFTPTAQMKSQGAAVVLFAPMRMTRTVREGSGPSGGAVQPTIVHVTLDELGNVQESEVLQTSGVSAQALAFVQQMKVWPVPQTGGTPPRQREAFVRVMFMAGGN